jgi:hypothetical protein
VAEARPEATESGADSVVDGLRRGADFAMLRLLFISLLPQAGGLILMLARRVAP